MTPPSRKKLLTVCGSCLAAVLLSALPVLAMESSCNDGVDNDTDVSSVNDGVAGQTPQNGIVDANPLTGADCLDYDCKGAANCPATERSRYDVASHTTVADDRACFDGVDNDMNGLVDCADPLCTGVISPDDPSKICRGLEFDVTNKYQYCANTFDDNGDGKMDCQDTSCFQVFGNCGPCPAREDINYAACTDGKDNNLDTKTDCKDPTCYLGTNGYKRFGTLGSASFPFSSPTYCAATEGTDATCHDGFDNDANGLTDCADPNCAAYCPWENSAGLCGDSKDNDGSGLMDCTDSRCYNLGSCTKAWSNATSCMPFPQWNPSTGFQAISVTMDARSYAATHVGSNDVVEIRGSGTYDSVTILIGDNTVSTAYYPYASATLCALSGTNAGMFSLGAVSNQILQVYSNEPDQTISGFDVTVTCSIPGATTPVPTPRTYPISIAAARSGTGEVGENNVAFSTKLYEATGPSVLSVEGEGWNSGISTLTVAYGERRSLRIIPSNDSSNICRCTASISGITLAPNLQDATGDCVTEKIMFPVTGTYTVDNLAAEDGVGNLGAPTSKTLDVVVTPSATQRLMLSPKSPWLSATFFKSSAGSSSAIANATFTTGATAGFTGATDCTPVLYADPYTATPLGSSPSPSLAATVNGAGPRTITCGPTIIGLPSLSDGEYFLAVRVTDAASKTGESNRVPIYICNNVPTYGETENVCSKADFDGDGAPEGLYSDVYTGSLGTPQVCDNCIGVQNPDQLDDNANGIGNGCEMDRTDFGRCEVDRNLVCLRDSLGAPSTNACATPGDPMCCPTPSVTPVSCTYPSVAARGDIYTDPEKYVDTAPGCPYGNGLCCPTFTTAPYVRANVMSQKCITEDTGLCTVGGSVCFSDWECHYCRIDTAKGCRTDSDCGPFTCSNAPHSVCQLDADCVALGQGSCLPPTDTCNVAGSSGAGQCTTDKKWCRRDVDCDQNSGEQTCELPPSGQKINLCESSLLPWLQTKYGSSFSTRGFFAPENPPKDQFNATFCLTSKGDITNFTSEACSSFSGKDTNLRYAQPNVANSFKTVVGGIDVPGLLSGRYGAVVNAYSASDVQALLATPLGGQVIRFFPSASEPDLVMASTITIPNGNGTVGGSGTVLVMGGDLYFNNNVTYATGQSISRIDDLASIAWVVLADATNDTINYCLATNKCSLNANRNCAVDSDCKKGNIYIGGLVTAVDGAFFSDGEDGISTTSTLSGQSLTGKLLTVNGLMVAHKVQLKRTYRRTARGSELIYYDGRAVLNPPPGLIDVARSLPTFGY